MAEKETIKVLICTCCNDEFTDIDEAWHNGKEIFCSENCIARWHGESCGDNCSEYAELLEDYGTDKEV